MILKDCRYEKMELDNHDPRHGVLIVNQSQPAAKRIHVDFLPSLHKMQAKESLKGRVELAENLFVINEFITLQNRVKNTIHLESKRKPVNFAQLGEAIAINRCAVRYLLDAGDEKKAVKMASTLLDYAAKNDAKQLFLRHNIDVLDCCFWQDSRLQPEFREKLLPLKLGKIHQDRDRGVRDRDRRIADKERKAARKAKA